MHPLSGTCRTVQHVTTEQDDLEQRLEAFRENIAPDAYSVGTFVPWDQIDHQIDELGGPITTLQGLVDSGAVKADDLAAALEQDPGIGLLAQRLFTAPHAVGFSDGRELPETFDPAVHRAGELAQLLIDLGFDRLLSPGTRVADLYRVAAIAVDARRRGFRRRADLDKRVAKLIDDAIDEVARRTGEEITRVPSPEQPITARNRGVEVIAADGRPVAAVASVFQAISGGRQYRDLSITYPRLQEDLDAVPMSLLLIADGRGLLSASRRVLETLLDSVAACLTLVQAVEGGLADALEAAVQARGVRRARNASLRTVIEARLRSETAVNAADLPAPRETAQAALAQYVSQNADLELQLSPDSSKIEWRRVGPVTAAQAVVREFSAEEAIRLLVGALRLEELEEVETGSQAMAMVAGTLPMDPVLHNKLAVASSDRPADPDLVADVARTARQHVAGANIAVLVVDDAATWRLGRSMTPQATSVVVIDGEQLMRTVASVRPRDTLIREVLAQADLTKASPFRSTGATPPEMFFGRHSEAADLLSILTSSSAALVGGRRIGKTSLMHHVDRTLGSEGWLPFYADLQEAGDWETFADYIRLRWRVQVEDDFSPSALALIVEQLASRGEGRLVLAFDEVDRLLRWDQDHGGQQVPEAFFRACRALSQEGAAQFVFSGERTIAERLWDPASPHWNFCRQLPVRQLDREAADALLERPLQSLGVRLSDTKSCLDLAWSRTHGHPQIIQLMGQSLVQALNDRAPERRGTIHSDDIEAIVSTLEYQEHYVTTYWGQATAYEKLVTALLALEATSVRDLRSMLHDRGIAADAEALAPALRMLALYGIIDEIDETLVLRAEWLPSAMQALGGPDQLVADLIPQII